MKNPLVIVERVFDHPIGKVWDAITDKAQLKQWYFDLDDFKPEVGFQFSFPGQGHKGEQYIHLCTITEVIPQKKLQYSWQYEGHPGYSLVTFELSERENKTHLKTHPQRTGDLSAGQRGFCLEEFQRWLERNHRKNAA